VKRNPSSFNTGRIKPDFALGLAEKAACQLVMEFLTVHDHLLNRSNGMHLLHVAVFADVSLDPVAATLSSTYPIHDVLRKVRLPADLLT
jgi:hypothetical protein